MYALWAYDIVKQEQAARARAGERRVALRQGVVRTAGWGRRILRVLRGRAPQPITVRLRDGARFVIPASVAREWKAA